jgi:putative DNA methylase
VSTNKRGREMAQIKAPKKLIEVALPLDDINAEASREKSIRHGHPSTLHLWWARRPLAAARAVLFAQLVNDPGGTRGWKSGVTKEQAQQERERLFGIMRRLVIWENSNDERVLHEAREEIWKSWRETCELNKGLPGFDPETLPAFHDPFAGGGSIPLEAQRLGLKAFASDLNPVAVLINKAMIEIPPTFSGLPPVNSGSRTSDDLFERAFKGAQGLAEDIRYYGQWMRDEAFKRIGHLYSQVELPADQGEGKATVIAWIWARTVKSPNPAYNHVDVPLVRSFWLSTREGRGAWVEPVIHEDEGNYHFEVRTSGKPITEGTVNRRGGTCIMSGSPIPFDYIRREGKAGRIGQRLMAVVAEGVASRIYLTPTDVMEPGLDPEMVTWRPQIALPHNPRSFQTPNYGMESFGDLFTNRQLVALNTFSDLIAKVRKKVHQDARDHGMTDDGVGLESGGTGALAYADAVAVYLAFALDKCTDYWCALCSWHISRDIVRNLFARQAIPMVWDFAEVNPFSESTGNWMSMINWVFKVVQHSPFAVQRGKAQLAEAQRQLISNGKIVSTDPPYYDNIVYADLSDFFYVWMRRSLGDVYPDLLATLAVPKAEELVATPYRHGSRDAANTFFMTGMGEALKRLADSSHRAFPVTIYYAFKQSDTQVEGTSSEGWISFLEALLYSGFSISGTWPLRTELSNRMLGQGTNALASSIVIVCRKRSTDAISTSRRQFIREINEALPDALMDMTRGVASVSPVAAVDLQQAAIGPGMAIFSKYASVLEADGSPMAVKTALQLINRVVDAHLNASEGETDAETLFCINWFDQYGWAEAEFGQADVLARAKGTSVDAVRSAGVLTAAQGKVRLLRWREYPSDWSPQQDSNTPVWEALHQMIRALQTDGEQAAGRLLAAMFGRSETIRALAYRLYTLCERKGAAEDARAYNELITSWDAIDEQAHDSGLAGEQLVIDLQ